MRNNFIYVRGLRKVDFTVFCVDNDQKKYWDKIFNAQLPFASGQQTKRSMLELMLEVLNVRHAPLTFNYLTDANKLKQKEVTQPCNPKYADQLLGGWMSAPKKNDKATEDEETSNAEVAEKAYKRRSPLSISALTVIHPLLGSLVNEKSMTFDRSESIDEEIVIKDSKNKILNEDEIRNFLNKNNLSLSKRKLISGKDRANGLFKYDVCIDLRRLFNVSLAINDPEISEDTVKELISLGWTEANTIFGRSLQLPKKFHKEYAEAIAHGIINWQISSNQSRTFDLMPLLSISISNNANEIANSIRADLNDETEKKSAYLVIDNKYPNTIIYSTNLLNGYVIGAETSYTAIDDAVTDITNRILEYYN